jgi:hypothetical protein
MSVQGPIKHPIPVLAEKIDTKKFDLGLNTVRTDASDISSEAIP